MGAGAYRTRSGIRSTSIPLCENLGRVAENAERVLGDLFRAYRDDATLLPEHVRARFEVDGEARAVSDYVAGMTDRFAMDEHGSKLDTP